MPGSSAPSELGTWISVVIVWSAGSSAPADRVTVPANTARKGVPVAEVEAGLKRILVARHGAEDDQGEAEDKQVVFEALTFLGAGPVHEEAPRPPQLPQPGGDEHQQQEGRGAREEAGDEHGAGDHELDHDVQQQTQARRHA